MNLNPVNFLKHLKNLVTGDPGFLRDSFDLLGLSVLATSVTRITASNYPVLSAAASITAVANVSFVVPRDYDELTDDLRITFGGKMGGATDTPTLTVAARKMTVGSASTALTASAASTANGISASPTAALSATDQSFTVQFLGQGLTRGQIVSVTITSGAHTTDALQLNHLFATYASTLVSYNESSSAGVPLR